MIDRNQRITFYCIDISRGWCCPVKDPVQEISWSKADIKTIRKLYKRNDNFGKYHNIELCDYCKSAGLTDLHEEQTLVSTSRCCLGESIYGFTDAYVVFGVMRHIFEEAIRDNKMETTINSHELYHGMLLGQNGVRIHSQNTIKSHSLVGLGGKELLDEVELSVKRLKKYVKDSGLKVKGEQDVSSDAVVLDAESEDVSGDS